MLYFNNLSSIHTYLIKSNKNIVKSLIEDSISICSLFNYFSNDKYKVFTLDNKIKNYIALRIEENNLDGCFGTYYNSTSRPIGSIDLIIDKQNKKLKIDWYLINNESMDKTNQNFWLPRLNIEDSNYMKKILFDFADSVAIAEGIKLIKMDVHQNLTYYKNDNLNELGFKLTDKRASDNSFWIVTEKQIIL
jgi:hypothetical protein